MITSRTKLLCIIGNPVGHSVSPQMHNAAFKSMGLDFSYVSFSVNNLADAMKGVRALGIRGGNVTIPYKTSVMQYMDECDGLSTGMNAVNTFVNDKGALKGFNTDGLGAVKTLEDEGVRIKGEKVAIVGAGGASKSISYVIAGKKPREIVILNRTQEKAEPIRKAVEKFGVKARALELSRKNLKTELSDSGILINTTPVGMHPGANETPVGEEFLHKNMAVMDVIFNPLETRLLREAGKKGAVAINGVGMLVNQGVLAFEIWTGKKPDAELMKEAAMESLAIHEK